MAIVGGVNLILSNEVAMTLDKGGVLGPDGICRSFDEKGNGYGRGEGIGVLVLKRVCDALRDGDTIRAVIRNSGSNQDGRSPGITQPTKAAQVDLIRRVYSQAGLDMSFTRFFEAHGTGTFIGDPIEASAIGELFGSLRSSEHPLYVGALKSNIGHLEGASGVAAVIKGVYTLENGVIPANTWLEKLNPKIQNSWHLQFPTESLPWPQAGLRRMSINSFGKQTKASGLSQIPVLVTSRSFPQYTNYSRCWWLKRPCCSRRCFEFSKKLPSRRSSSDCGNSRKPSRLVLVPR